MQDLNDLFYYSQIVEHGGLAAAGRALDIPKSKLSRRLAALEERLGVRLIQRSTRRFDVTPMGQIYFKHCKAMLVEAEAAQQSIDSAHGEPCGVIRVSCPIALLHAHVGGMLADFMTRFPQVEVQLDATNRSVDLVAEGVDVAIRVRPLPFEDSDLVLRVLSDRGICLVASPSLLEQYGLPKHPQDLAEWPSMVRGSPDRGFSWELYGPNEAAYSERFTPRFITSDMTALQTAALAGVGVVQLPHLMVKDDLASGRLLHLLPEWAPRREVIHAVYPSRRGLLPAVRTLINHLAESYAAFEED